MTSEKILKAGVIAAAVLTVAACSSYDMNLAERTAAYKEFVATEDLIEKQRVVSFRMEGWTPLSNEHLIVRHRVNRYYLLSLRTPCYDLDMTPGIVFEASDNILDARFDWISTTGFPERRCYINTIHELTAEQRKALLEIGKKKQADA